MTIQFDEQEFLTRIYDKLEKIQVDQTEIKVTLAKQSMDLNHHVFRTDLAENNIELLRKQLEQSAKLINDKIEPILQKENQVTGMIKLFGAVAAVIGTLGTAVTIIYYFIK